MDRHATRKLIVGVGASAGGLTPLKELVSSLPAKTGMSFVVIQHLDPSHKSMLVEILEKTSVLEIEEAHDDQEIKADHIYVIPPDAYLEVKAGRLRVVTPEHTRGTRKAIDHFMKSLARDCGDGCVGIVMSGSGSDGTAGLRAIRAAGGLTLVQDPLEAEHPGMPASAIDAGVVDRMMKVAEMCELLLRYADSPLLVEAEASEEKGNEDAEESLAAIGVILKSHEDFNLQQYKPPTVLRRIARRMSLAAARDFSEYLDLLRESSAERGALIKDLLINVTNFFRDPEAFAELKTQVIEKIVKEVNHDDDVRIWVPGCASGEEAYSIAIVVREAIETASLDNGLRLFATDVDEHAISIARKGQFPENIAADVPAPLLKKYFDKRGGSDGYQIAECIRESISFAVHDVAHDQPFGRMDLISCRNLLIYLKKNIQQDVLGAFYLALRTDGYLFLGSSEAVGPRAEMFRTLGKKWRIYQKKRGHDNPALTQRQSALIAANQSHRVHQRSDRDHGMLSRSEIIRRDLLDTFVRPGVVVSSDGRVLYNHGNWSAFMAMSSGEPRVEIADLVVPEMQSRLRSALYKIRKTRNPICFYCALPNKGDRQARNVRVDLALLPQVSIEEEAVIGIVFNEIDESVTEQSLTSDDEIPISETLERELAETREELQSTIEELETSTEELKASHEETLSTNEELQSTNEELEASSEELRSMNEELSTVNVQLKEKIGQLNSSRDDVENFFQSTNIPTLFLSPDLKIQRFTPAIERLLKLGTRDLGRSIHSIGSQLTIGLAKECESVLQDFQPAIRETSCGDDHWYLRKVTPYRTVNRRVEGVVVVYQEITEIRELSHRAESRERQQSVVANLGIMALSGTDPEALMHNAVRQIAHVLDADYCKVLEYHPKEKELLMVAGIGWHDGLVGKATVTDHRGSQAGYTLLSQHPIIVRRLTEEKRFQGPNLLTEHEVVSGMSCVIGQSDPPYGVLGVHTRQFRKFTDDDMNFLVSVANLLSIALHTKAAASKLYRSEEQFRSLANSIPQLAWSADIDGNMIWFNKRWYNYTGTRLKDVKNWGWGRLVHTENVEKVTGNIKRWFSEGKEWEETFPIRGKSGDYRWFLTRAVPFRNSDGDIISWFGTNTDISEQREQAQALHASEQKLRLAMNTNLIGTFEFFLIEEKTNWDGILRTIWGVADDETVTQALFWQGVHPDDAEQVRQALDEATAPNSEGRYHETYRVVNRRTGDVHWVEASGQTLVEDGVPIRMVGMVIDITARKMLEESLHDAVAELRQADTKKNEFLAVLGHELRNPLAALSSSVETLKIKPSAVSKVLDIMRNSVATMARLLDDLLDLNRISQNRIQLEFRPLDVTVPLQSAIAGHGNIISARLQHLETDFDTGLIVEGDATRLEQVFVNLLTNASKYTPEKGQVLISAKRAGADVEIRVVDSGVGIDKEYLEQIFAPFFQVKPKEDVTRGLGVGLALSRKLVELHGGTIEAKSEGENTGTTFLVRMPASELSKPKRNKRHHLKLPSIRPGTRVVLIDDNEDVLKTLPALLESLQCVTETASTGEYGLTCVGKMQPDAVLVDIGLPDISGYEVARRLRAGGFEGLLVAVSGYGHEEARESSSAAGFDLHLAKPARLEEISAALSSV